MGLIDRKQAPYLDDFDPSKNYSHMLAVPGRVEQARDFTQVQTMIYEYLKRLSDTLLRDGSIVSGMGYVLSGTTLTVKDGRVYMNGKVHNFSEQQITLTLSGVEKVGVKLNETIVTEEEDPTLLDQTTLTGNYGQPGSHRIKSEIVLTVNDDESAIIYEFDDGALKTEVSKPNYDTLEDTLAKRTYDESGNYRVSGLEIHVEPYDANNVLATVEAGTAYVKGYQVIKPTPTKIKIPMAKDYRTINGEPKIYKSGTTQYSLNHVPARGINRVTAYVQVSESITRSSTLNGKDPLSSSPVVDIISVVQGSTTYIQGTDYQLTDDSIDWGLGGAEPTSGTAYTVTYRFNKTLVQGTDYDMYSVIGDYGETKDYVRFLNGDKPSDQSTFYVDYDNYLARVDLLSLSKDGDVVLTPGQSDIVGNAKPPVAVPDGNLQLGTVALPPNSGNATATFNSITRLDMDQLQDMMKRVQDLEYNQAITALDQETMDGEVTTNLRGIFSDSFRSTNRADLTFNGFDIMFDLETGTIRLPLRSDNTFKPVVSNTVSVQQYSSIATAPMMEVVAANQPYATTTMLINPYQAFNAMGTLKLSPSKDSWIETTYINVNNVQYKARNFYRWWRHGNSKYKNAVKDLFGLTMIGTDSKTVSNWRPEIGDTGVAVKVDRATKEVEQAITYMRQIDVTLESTNLKPNADNLTCYFDGNKVNLTAISPSTTGSTTGTIKADASGHAKGKFTIPAGIRTGTREVKLSNADNEATTSFTSNGTKRTITTTITTTYITLTAVDPLAQSFMFDEDTTLTSVGVYFSSNDGVNNVICQIRNVVNGYPGNVVYASKTLTPSDIKTSSNASTETKITFDDPVVCDANTQYCMVFETNSATNGMFVSDLGGTDVTTGSRVLSQPYISGVLFSSSNAITWTAHQTMNMKFKLYKAQFNTSTTIDFNTITGLSADTLVLMGDYMIPDGCSIVWKVSLDGGAYQAILPEEDTDLVKSCSTVKLRAEISTSGSMSPMLDLDTLQLIAMETNTTGAYISRNVELADPMTHVVQTYDAYIPSGCSIYPQFSYDNGSTWITPTQTNVETISSEYTRYTCEADVPSAANATNFRARLNITANSPTLRPRARRFANVMK